jgi:hypothetical protein
MCYSDFPSTKVKISGEEWFCIAGIATWMLPPQVSPRYDEHFDSYIRTAIVAHNWTDCDDDQCHRRGRVKKTQAHIEERMSDPSVPPEWNIMSVFFYFLGMGEGMHYEKYDNYLSVINQYITAFKHRNPTHANGAWMQWALHLLNVWKLNRDVQPIRLYPDDDNFGNDLVRKPRL